jgi:hypothetical protein
MAGTPGVDGLPVGSWPYFGPRGVRSHRDEIILAAIDEVVVAYQSVLVTSPELNGRVAEALVLRTPYHIGQPDNASLTEPEGVDKDSWRRVRTGKGSPADVQAVLQGLAAQYRKTHEKNFADVMDAEAEERFRKDTPDRGIKARNIRTRRTCLMSYRRACRPTMYKSGILLSSRPTGPDTYGWYGT